MRHIFLKLMLLLPALIAAPGCSSRFSCPGTLSEWEGCTRYDFQVEGRDAIVVLPEKAAKGRPWILRPAFFDAFAQVDKVLLREGWAVAYYDVTHLYGSPRAVELMKKFYDYAIDSFPLAKRMTLEGFSRGGYFSFAWAEAYPETVSCLYVDAPVCDITSWPGRASELWPDFLAEWGLEDSEVGPDFVGNALSHLPSIAAAHIPIVAVCGDSDATVPYEENFKPFYEAYRALGEDVELFLKPGCDHHPHSLENPSPVVGFIKARWKSEKKHKKIF